MAEPPSTSAQERLKLAPCPFCGGKPVIRQRSHSMPREPSFQIQCGECYCGTSDRYETAEYAAAPWNRRSADGEIARLKVGLKREAEAHVAEANARMKAESALDEMRRMVGELDALLSKDPAIKGKYGEQLRILRGAWERGRARHLLANPQEK